MRYVLEEFYNVAEAALITGFFSAYFGTKASNSRTGVIISFIIILAANTFTTIFYPSWFILFICMTFLFFGLLELLFKGSRCEHFLISLTTCILLAITEVCVLTAMSRILGADYSKLAAEDSPTRFLTVIITKIFTLILFSIIVSIKKKHSLYLHGVEYFLICATLFISVILLTLMRIFIYNSAGNYRIFLVIVLCLLLINIGQYYTMLYISRKNISEQEISLMKKQLEMQEKCIGNLEEKYDETLKIRHDMKNYISCALRMAQEGDNNELIGYLKELTEEKLNPVTNYVHIKRKVIGAVINTKLGTALRKGIDMKCMVLSEMEGIDGLDAGIILANLIDNALEACERNTGKSEIRLKIWNKANYCCVKISNTVETDILAENPHLKTSKADKKLHGVGLKSVKDIVEKYSGMLNYQQKADNFYVYVSLFIGE